MKNIPLQQPFISSYYKGYYGITNRSWRRLGLKFLDVDKGILDNNHIISVFSDCKGLPVPNRIVTLYLIWAQVRVFSNMLAKREDTLLVQYTFGIPAEILYDRLTDRMLTKHNDVYMGDRLSPKFTKAPVPWLLNVVKRTIKDSIYDMYRYEHDKKAGRPVRLRSPSKKVLLDKCTLPFGVREAEEVSDLMGYSDDNSPWAEMERLNTGKSLWEN